jgi:hypothetical protein
VSITFSYYVSSYSLQLKVPLYDAREDKSFAFSDDDFSRLRDLPFFKGARDPEPERYVASVGFTVNSFPYNGNQAGYHGLPQVMLNIMFAIILGKLNN